MKLTDLPEILSKECPEKTVEALRKLRHLGLKPIMEHLGCVELDERARSDALRITLAIAEAARLLEASSLAALVLILTETKDKHLQTLLSVSALMAFASNMVFLSRPRQGAGFDQAIEIFDSHIEILANKGFLLNNQRSLVVEYFSDNGFHEQIDMVTGRHSLTGKISHSSPITVTATVG